MKLPRRTQQFDLHLTYNPLGSIAYAILQVDWIGTGFRVMRQWTCYQLVLVLDGTGVYRDTAGKSFPLRAGDLFITTPHARHQYGPAPGKVWTELAIGFHGEVFDAWHRAGVLKTQEHAQPLSPLADWYQKFMRLLTPTAIEREQSIFYILRLLAFIERLPLNRPRRRPPDQPRWLQHALELIEGSDFSSPCPLRKIASRCGVGIHTFRRTFARVMQMGPATYHQKLRMEAAAHTLMSTPSSAKEIGGQLGFTTLSHFSRSFRKHTGFSPREFRRAYAGKQPGIATLAFPSKRSKPGKARRKTVAATRAVPSGRK